MTTQMTALDEYFLMVVFTLLLSRVNSVGFLYFIWAEKHGIERVKVYILGMAWDSMCYFFYFFFQLAIGKYCLKLQSYFKELKQKKSNKRQRLYYVTSYQHQKRHSGNMRAFLSSLRLDRPLSPADRTASTKLGQT